MNTKWGHCTAKGKLKNGNSGLIIPPPQDQHRPKNKLKNQHQQRIAQCVGVAMHVRVGGLLGVVWESPGGAEGSLAR